MGTIVDKQDILSVDNEETNNVHLKEAIYQQINLIELDDLNVVLYKN